MESKGSVGCHRSAMAAVPGLVLVWLVVSGCGATRTPPAGQFAGNEVADAGLADGADGADEAAPSEQADQTPAQTDALASQSMPADAAATEPQVPAPQELQSVGPEDARRGSTITGGGIITEPLRQYFLIQHRYVLDNVKYAVKLYEASEGHKPRSHEEFMTEIIEKNNLELPELQPGWDYYYDATDGELKQRKMQ